MDRVTYAALIILTMVLCLPLLLRRTAALSEKRQQAVKYGVFVLYIIINLYLTLFSRIGDSVTRINLVPLWSYRAGIRSILQGGFGAEENPLTQILLNILLYIPMGYLLPMLQPALLQGRTRQLTIWKIVWIGLCTSVATEAVQLLFHIGWSDIDDIISNTLGTVAGVLLYIGTKDT